MPAPLVVHVGLVDDAARALTGASSPLARHVAPPPGRTAASLARADVVVLHGPSGRRAGRLRHGRALVVRRARPGDRPGLADRRALRWTDLVVVGDERDAPTWTAAIDRPGRTVVVEPDDTATSWGAIVVRALAPVARAATRAVGDELLVAPATPTGEVERLSGGGPAAWELLAAGRTPEEVAAELGGDDAEAVAAVRAFVATLAERGLEPAS